MSYHKVFNKKSIAFALHACHFDLRCGLKAFVLLNECCQVGVQMPPEQRFDYCRREESSSVRVKPALEETDSNNRFLGSALREHYSKKKL